LDELILGIKLQTVEQNTRKILLNSCRKSSLPLFVRKNALHYVLQILRIEVLATCICAILGKKQEELSKNENPSLSLLA